MELKLNQFNNTSLIDAATNNRIEIIKQLLAYPGININCRDI